MNYIGSKLTLLNFIESSIRKTLITNNELRKPSEMIFADLFSGTGCVGSRFKSLGYSIIANDIQYYSYVITKHLIENNGNLNKIKMLKTIDELNKLNGFNGFIYRNYTFEGTEGQEYRRMYFSAENARKCDAIRNELDILLKENKINKNEFYFLLGSLITSIDKYSNTASVYGAYLKKLKSSALKSFVLSPLPFPSNHVNCRVYNEDVNNLISKIYGDILYLDPPYNERQYCANYHILETIAKNDNPVISGKTGLRDYKSQKSDYCIKSKVCSVFEDLIKNANFKYIFLSYNNEGLMNFDEIKNIMSKYGEYSIYSQEYRRFKADNKRSNKSKTTIEYLHCLIKKRGE